MSSPDERVALVGVYRARYAPLVRDLRRQAAAQGWTVAWWALDHVVDDLAEWTVGSGPGAKLPLVNEILRRIEQRAGWVVVSDDDVEFERGDLGRLFSLCVRAGFDLAQPARIDDAVDHDITAPRRLSVARRTSFVEIGPLFLVGPGWWNRIVPFPEGRGMGWGIELDWFGLSEEGCALGIVDAVWVRHQGKRGRDYDYRSDAHRVHAELESKGFDGWSAVQKTFGTWRPWQRSPRWVAAKSAA